jgi:hypothetical protein
LTKIYPIYHNHMCHGQKMLYTVYGLGSSHHHGVISPFPKDWAEPIQLLTMAPIYHIHSFISIVFIFCSFHRTINTYDHYDHGSKSWYPSVHISK